MRLACAGRIFLGVPMIAPSSRKEASMLETTIAGSLPKPAWLAEPEKLWAAWRQEGAELERAKQDAALVWLKEQEAAGIDVVSDGEQFRVHFVHGFLETIEGIDWAKKTKMGIRDNRYVVDVPTVTGPVRRSRPVHRDEVRFMRAHTEHRLKVTLPGPMTICDTIADVHYGRRADMALAFAALLNEEALELEAAGADVVQFDEPAFNVFMADVAEWGVTALERAAEGLACRTAVHICYGYGIEANIRWKETLGGEWRQYEAIFPALNASRIDQVSLECANSHVPLELLALLPDKELLVGAIDVATQQVETPEQVAAVIRAALQHVDAARLLPCTNCGMAPLPRAVAAGKLRALGAGARLVRRELS
jgi:5-methyltetrahydropteroyltriglutamate--homocysteine methyltransferase